MDSPRKMLQVRSTPSLDTIPHRAGSPIHLLSLRATSLRAIDFLDIALDQLLHNDHVPPHSVKLAMFFVNAYFTKSKRTSQAAAAGIFGKDTRYQLPVSRLLTSHDEGVENCSASPTTSTFAGNVHRCLGNSLVAITRPVDERRSEGDDLPFILGHHDRMNAVKPGGDILSRSQSCLKRGNPVL